MGEEGPLLERHPFTKPWHYEVRSGQIPDVTLTILRFRRLSERQWATSTSASLLRRGPCRISVVIRDHLIGELFLCVVGTALPGNSAWLAGRKAV